MKDSEWMGKVEEETESRTEGTEWESDNREGDRMMREEIGRVLWQRGRKGKYSVQHKRLRRDRWLQEEANFPTGFPPAEDVLCNAGSSSRCFVWYQWWGTNTEEGMCSTVIWQERVSPSVSPFVTWILVSQSYSWSASKGLILGKCHCTETTIWLLGIMKGKSFSKLNLLRLHLQFKLLRHLVMTRQNWTCGSL